MKLATIIIIISNYHLCEMKNNEKYFNNNFKLNIRSLKFNLHACRHSCGSKERILVHYERIASC